MTLWFYSVLFYSTQTLAAGAAVAPENQPMLVSVAPIQRHTGKDGFALQGVRLRQVWPLLSVFVSLISYCVSSVPLLFLMFLFSFCYSIKISSSQPLGFCLFLPISFSHPTAAWRWRGGSCVNGCTGLNASWVSFMLCNRRSNHIMDRCFRYYFLLFPVWPSAQSTANYSDLLIPFWALRETSKK